METELLTTKQTQLHSSLNMAENVQTHETQVADMKIVLEQVVKASDV